jgi:hypothetical protein
MCEAQVDAKAKILEARKQATWAARARAKDDDDDVGDDGEDSTPTPESEFALETLEALPEYVEKARRAHARMKALRERLVKVEARVSALR